MSSKVIDARAGDRWTKDNDGILWLYREDTCTMYTATRGYPCCSIFRFADEIDIPTPEAHAQLREWGYEVRGDVDKQPIDVTFGGEVVTRYRDGHGFHSMGYPKPFTTIDGVTWAGAGLDNASDWASDEPPLTESRVREIVEEVLAAKQNLYSQIREWGKVEVKTDPRAAKPAPAPEPDWRGLLAELVKWYDLVCSPWKDNEVPVTVRGAFEDALASARTNLAAKGGK